MRNLFISMATAQERDRLKARVDQIKSMMDQIAQGPKRDEVKKQLVAYEEGLSLLEAKTKELQEKTGQTTTNNQQEEESVSKPKSL